LEVKKRRFKEGLHRAYRERGRTGKGLGEKRPKDRWDSPDLGKSFCGFWGSCCGPPTKLRKKTGRERRKSRPMHGAGVGLTRICQDQYEAEHTRNPKRGGRDEGLPQQQ